MKAYWIALYKRIDSQENLKNYGAKVTGIIKSYGGKPLVRGGKFETLEGETYPRTVIWEFPNHEQAMKCHDSKEYQDGWAIARDTTERNLQIVEGFVLLKLKVQYHLFLSSQYDRHHVPKEAQQFSGDLL